jgi:hypothetical protein
MTPRHAPPQKGARVPGGRHLRPSEVSYLLTPSSPLFVTPRPMLWSLPDHIRFGNEKPRHGAGANQELPEGVDVVEAKVEGDHESPALRARVPVRDDTIPHLSRCDDVCTHCHPHSV